MTASPIAGSTTLSTLDRIGDGLTIFAAAADPRWADTATQTGFTAPREEVIVEAPVAAALGLEPTGAVLVRPDGHEVARWATRTAEPDRGIAWL